MRILAFLTVIVASLAAAFFFTSIGEAKSAPQQAAVAAMAMAPVICLYVLTRAVEMYNSCAGPRS